MLMVGVCLKRLSTDVMCVVSRPVAVSNMQ